MNLLNENNEIKIEVEPLVILDFTTKYSSINLDLGNNFTLKHFFAAFKDNYYYEQINDYLATFDYDTIFKLLFIGNYGNIEINISCYDYNDFN